MNSADIKKFERHVSTKYHLFNSLFLRLPFSLIHPTGTMLPLLSEKCDRGYKQGMHPREILDSFFEEFHPESNQRERLDILFNIIKYIERQVVLFDAVEEAAFEKLHNLNGPGTMHHLLTRAHANEVTDALERKLESYRLRIVLTAHPTQFYPGTVLGIITDLTNAIRDNRIFEVHDLLLQLGKTPFINRIKPTPLDEARSLIWYLRHVFYSSIPASIHHLESGLSSSLSQKNIIELGFWPGGDRDGNPNVTTAITLETAALLHQALLSCYHDDVQILRKRLTFQHVYEKITAIGDQLYQSITSGQSTFPDPESLLRDLRAIRSTLAEKHDDLFAEELERFIDKVEIFGLHFASLDIRQDSRMHEALLYDIISQKEGPDALQDFVSMPPESQMAFLNSQTWNIDETVATDPIGKDIVGSIMAIQEIQKQYGIRACHRYIISQTRHAVDLFTLYTLARWSSRDSILKFDIVPLFESIEDLAHAADVMEQLYQFAPYMDHLGSRGRIQYVMVGFSDGTKDGGYLKANWSIYSCKEAMTRVSEKYGIRVVFFDGRGGPPARGGGNTHKFYASQGTSIENKEIQLTIQGQTISSKFGSPEMARFNLEQLLTAGIENDLYPNRTKPWTAEHRGLMDEMAGYAFEAYSELRNHPQFLTYLQDNGTLLYYGESNIGSRPDKRSATSALSLENLRAIPFVGSWAQLKQNVPGYYGLGTAIEKIVASGREETLQEFYQKSGFFQTLVSNSLQSLAKSFFPLTAHHADHPLYGEIWNLIHNEYERTRQGLMKCIHADSISPEDTTPHESIELREKIVLPLLTIQQYAITHLKELQETKADVEMAELYKKLITRTMPGIINAARNSA